MEPFVIFEGVAAPMDQPQVDTGQILPARFLRRPRKEGYAAFLFRDMRYMADDQENPEFILNQAPFRQARILVGNDQFGAGSSREQATWALMDYGIRCVVAAEFGEIFYANSIRTGLLPVQLDAPTCARLRSQLHDAPGAGLRVDLPHQTVTGPDGAIYSFMVDDFRKRCLIEGLDDVDFTLRQEPTISAFEKAYRERFDWLFKPPLSVAKKQ